MEEAVKQNLWDALIHGNSMEGTKNEKEIQAI